MTNKLRILCLALSLTSVIYAEQEPPAREVTKEEIVEEDRIETRSYQTVKTKQRAGSLIVFDHSGSMAGTLDGNKIAVQNFLAKLPPTEPVGFLPFRGCYSNPDQLRAELIDVKTGNHQAILTKLSRLRADGGTDLFLALNLAKQLIADTSQYYIEIFLLTDDQDTCSQKDWRQLLKELQQSQVTTTVQGKVRTKVQKIKVHVITEAVGQAAIRLEELAKATGGKYVAAENEMDKFRILQGLLKERVQTQVETHASAAAQDEVADKKEATEEEYEEQATTMSAKRRATNKNRAEQKKTRNNNP